MFTFSFQITDFNVHGLVGTVAWYTKNGHLHLTFQVLYLFFIDMILSIQQRGVFPVRVSNQKVMCFLASGIAYTTYYVDGLCILVLQ